MTDIQIVSFDELMGVLSGENNNSLLLGNGFSVACRPDIFRYDAIFDRVIADLPSKDVNRIKTVFDTFGTRDFEKVIFSLERFADIGPEYRLSKKSSTALLSDAKVLRDKLVDGIAKSHPEGPYEIDDTEFASCARFLTKFNSIYTINYDLLLYWTVLNQNLTQFTDGFGEPEEKDADYVEWELGGETSAKMHYLHGALHLFDMGSSVRKVSWCRTGKTLKEQVIEQLRYGKFPLFVAEGDADSKMRAINSNGYLARTYRSFQSKGGHLVVFGCSFSDNDTHIVRAIEQGKWQSLSIGLHGKISSDNNRNLIARCEQIKTAHRSYLAKRSKRNQQSDLPVRYYDSSTAYVWGAKQP